jgi:hypothetical protein
LSVYENFRQAMIYIYIYIYIYYEKDKQCLDDIAFGF